MFYINKGVLLILIFVLLSENSYASSCYSKSPSLIVQEDSYFNTRDSGLLPVKDQNVFKNIIKSLDGRWSGSSKLLTCQGSMKSPKEKIVSIKKTSKISSFNKGRLEIGSTDYYIDEKINRRSKVKLSYGDNGTYINVSNNNGFSVSKKYRIPNSKNLIVEEIYDISKDNEVLYIKIKKYTNGYLSSRETWSLSK